MLTWIGGMTMLAANIITTVVLVHQFSQAILAGFAAARDPAHRVTLLEGAFFFEWFYRRRLRNWRNYWLVFPLLFVIALNLRLPSGALVLIYLPWSLLACNACIMFAPRCRQPWVLTMLSLSLMPAFLVGIGLFGIMAKYFGGARADTHLWAFFLSCYSGVICFGGAIALFVLLVYSPFMIFNFYRNPDDRVHWIRLDE